jgi:hypothetical protein
MTPRRLLQIWAARNERKLQPPLSRSTLANLVSLSANPEPQRLDIEIFLVIEPASFPMNPYSRPASVRGCRCSFPRPSPTFEYLFSVPHSHPVSLLVPIEQPVLTRRANPLLPLTRQLACHRRRPLLRAPSRRYLSRQENKWKRAQHVLRVCTQLRCTQ